MQAQQKLRRDIINGNENLDKSKINKRKQIFPIDHAGRYCKISM